MLHARLTPRLASMTSLPSGRASQAARLAAALLTREMGAVSGPDTAGEWAERSIPIRCQYLRLRVLLWRCEQGGKGRGKYGVGAEISPREQLSFTFIVSHAIHE